MAGTSPAMTVWQCSSSAGRPRPKQTSQRRYDKCPLSGVKRTWAGAVQMSAFDPKRTSVLAQIMSAKYSVCVLIPSQDIFFVKKDIAVSLVRCVGSDAWQHGLSCNRNMGAIHDPALTWDIWFFSDSFDDTAPV